MEALDLLHCIHGAEKLRSYSGPACVVGASRSVWDEFSQVPADIPIIAANVIGCFLPRLDHWVSIHPETFAAANPLRTWLAQHHPKHVTLKHTWKHARGDIDMSWFGDIPPELSGCFALMVALRLGYSPVYLCGISHDSNGHVYEPHGLLPHVNYDFTCHTWFHLAEWFQGQVIPMGGRLKELFK